MAIIDDADWSLVAPYKWYAHHGGNTWYAKAYVKGARRHKIIQMHRIILGCVPGDGVEVDHDDGNGLNNRRSNIHAGSRSRNQRNRHHAWGKSGVLGVFKDRNRWRAEVRRNGRSVYLGAFNTIPEAAAARENFLAVESNTANGS